METLFENRKVSMMQPGFPDMHDFFMGRNPGALGAMLGKYGELELPVPVFLDTLRTGLSRDDAAALEFRYRSISDFIGCRNTLVWYDREGWPMVTMKGEAFPNTHITFDMAFLKNGSMAWDGYVFSDKLVVEKWYKTELEKLVKEEENIKLDMSGVYREHTGIPEAAAQFHRYPDLAKVMVELQTEEKHPFTKAVEDIAASLEGNWRVYGYIQPSEEQKRVMGYYGVFKYLMEVACFVPTLNEIVAETKKFIPLAQETYMNAWYKFRYDS